MTTQDLAQTTAGSISAAAREPSKLRTPPPRAMTPPPTSEEPLSASHFIQTPPPTNNQLSSPPPTHQKQITTSHFSSISPVMYSTKDIEEATAQELRAMVTHVMDEYHTARTASAHHKYQQTLLAVESAESINRLKVEIVMLRRDIEVLLAKANNTLATPAMSDAHFTSPSDRLILNLKNTMSDLEKQNDDLRSRLNDARIAYSDREEYLLDEIEQLQNRIRQNRAHMNLLRRTDMLHDTSTVSASAPTTNAPAQTTNQNAHAARHQVSTIPKTAGDQAFAALLLADQVLSQGTTTTRANLRSSTNDTIAPTAAMQRTTLPSRVPGPYFATPVNGQLSPPAPIRGLAPVPYAQQQRRRLSRDSTISASDMDQRGDSSDEDEVDLTLPETKNTRAASTRKQLGLVYTPGAGSSAKTNASPASEKKRKMDDDISGTPKKSKLLEGVGLGIGGMGSSPPMAD